MEYTARHSPDKPRSREPTPQGDKPPRRDRAPQEPSLLKDFLLLLLKIGAILLAFALAFTFLYGLHRTPDDAMAPAMREGDVIVYYRLNKYYTIGDALLLEVDGKQQVRRVVATAGDTVDITEDGLFVNGARQNEPNIYHDTQRYAEGIEFPITLHEDQVFVLGDERENSTDSRIYGAVNVEDTFGKVIASFRRRNL